MMSAQNRSVSANSSASSFASTASAISAVSCSNTASGSDLRCTGFRRMPGNPRARVLGWSTGLTSPLVGCAHRIGSVELKAGTRLRSAVDGVEAIIVKAQGDVDLRCGGHPMLAAGTDAPAGVTVAAGFDKGTLLGKRYVNESGDLEVLCTKPG